MLEGIPGKLCAGNRARTHTSTSTMYFPRIWNAIDGSDVLFAVTYRGGTYLILLHNENLR